MIPKLLYSIRPLLNLLAEPVKYTRNLFIASSQGRVPPIPERIISINSSQCQGFKSHVRKMAGSGSPIKFYPVTHVIFDVDGLLIDSEKYYSESLTLVCKKYGKEFTWKIKSEMMGTTPKEGAAICLSRLGLTDKLKSEDFIAQYEVEMKRLAPNISLMPGARRLIEHLQRKSIPMAIATGSARTNFDIKTGHLGDILRKPFAHHVYAGSDPEVKHGKPSPDVFIQAGKRFSSPPKSPQNFLVFEDAVNGVKAAVAAGMQVVLVPDKRTDLSGLDVKPTMILESLEQFRPELFGLPPFDK